MNFIIRLLSFFAPKLNGNPEEWLERPYPLMGEIWREFNCGSVRGIYRAKNKNYEILAIQNTKGGNGHFKRTMKWFEDSARRDKFGIVFLEVGNPKLKDFLKRKGFKEKESDMIK